ncbi:phosphoethanolamine transferase [Helicobacter kayseriensis]|uniref:phosphoethanolamine transferase n=1 Tax=Helicobacter kayseriensis TaxID=2905877 RepID=UPI001E590094|nr:phosphoethanolamine transferase [Helicobacter kayseriensis]MCE3047238.1 phosphoethanolamine transferase [Helicobacter kayseriensis]MCE3048609.1 phosphoethanolamine transferase [Helicobacter kayseriensis]
MGFYTKSFLYLSVIYWISYVCSIWGRNFSISTFVAQLSGFFILAFCIALSFKLKRFGKLCLYVWLILSTVMFFVDLACLFIFETSLTGAMILTLWETNISESLSFFELYSSQILKALGVGMVCIALVLCALRVKFRIKTLWIMGFVIIGGVLGVYETYLLASRGISSCQYRNQLFFISPLRFGCDTYLAFSDLRDAQKTLAYYQKLLEQEETYSVPPPLEGIKNIALILGESTQRNHMQIYGYQKPTTPRLQSLVKKGNLFVFSDVVSPHAQTTLSLRKMLTFSNVENSQIPWYEQGNLIGSFRGSGYRVVWISNQLNATHGGSTGIIASLSHETHFVSEYKRNFDEVFYDGKLLEAFDHLKPMDSKNHLYVFHLMGAHASYGKRYPETFAYFDDATLDLKKRTIARYDNAIFYNDYVVSEICERFANQDSLVLYVPDHGEEVYDAREFAGHADDNMSRFMVEIPFIVYVSDLFKKKHPLIYHQIQQSLKRPYMTDDLIHTLLDIAGIRVSGFDPTRSLISPSFNPTRKRIVGGSEGRDYDKELKSAL